MNTNQDTTSKYVGDANVCGFCNKHMRGDTKPHWLFQKCDLCNKSHPLHPKCASKLWAGISSNKDEKVPPFDNAVFMAKKSVGLWCFECKSKCFYCHVTHKHSGKLFYIIYNSKDFGNCL